MGGFLVQPPLGNLWQHRDQFLLNGFPHKGEGRSGSVWHSKKQREKYLGICIVLDVLFTDAFWCWFVLFSAVLLVHRSGSVGGLFGVRSGFRSWPVRVCSGSVGYRSGSFISVVPMVCTGGVDPLPHCLARSFLFGATGIPPPPGVTACVSAF